MVPDKVWDTVAQISHVLFGLCVVAYTVIIFSTHALYYSVPGIVVLTAIKEFWFDENYETPDERGSNLKDFLFYCMGVLIGLAVILLVGKK